MSAETIIYTPARVEYLLRRLPYLLDRHAPSDEHVSRRPARSSPSGWLEDRMCEQADILNAMQKLPQPTYQMVYLSYVGNRSIREVAAIVKVSRETVRRHRIDGVHRIAWELGWRDAEAGWP